MHYDTQFLPTISDEFYAKGISSMDSSIQCLAGRSLAILWRNSQGEKFNIVDPIEYIDVVNNFISSDHLPLLLLLNCKCFHVIRCQGGLFTLAV